MDLNGLVSLVGVFLLTLLDLLTATDLSFVIADDYIIPTVAVVGDGFFRCRRRLRRRRRRRRRRLLVILCGLGSVWRSFSFETRSCKFDKISMMFPISEYMVGAVDGSEEFVNS